MEEEKMLSELIENRNANLEKLRELLETYDLAEIGRKTQDQHEKDICNRVLRENEFFASTEFERIGIKIGDRITDEKDDFLLSDEDFQRVHYLMLPILVAENVTDEKGYYIIDWSSKSSKAWVELVNFIIQKILPSPFRETYWENRFYVVKMNKLIEAVRKIA